MEEKAKMQALEDDKLRAEVVKRIDEAEKARASPVPDAPTATITQKDILEMRAKLGLIWTDYNYRHWESYSER